MEASQPSIKPQVSRKEAVNRLWRLGVLHWKLDPNQLGIYKQIDSSPHKTHVISASRRMGKTFMLTLMANEKCLQQANSVVKFVAPEGKMIKRDIRLIMREIYKDCPSDIKPKFNSQDNIYYFHNGSELQLAGSDNGNADSLRGGTSVLCIVDEAGFANDLDYLIKSILLPTTLTTKGKIILASTPPREPGHEFASLAQNAEHKGTLIKRTVYDNPRITQEDLDSIISEYPGGKDDIQFKREYECVFLVSEKDAVVPEFTAELEAEIVRSWDRPPFYDGYLGMDIGFKDLTAGIFAYWDFRSGVLVIEDTFSLQGAAMTTDKLASIIKEREARVWQDPVTLQTNEPYLRVSDNNLILINDLYRLHGLKVLATQKDNFEAALNNVRLWLQQKKIIINPRCKDLILHLRNATWNKARTQFSRSTTFGHFDFVHALIYLVRNVNTRRNPYPPGYEFRDLQQQDLFYKDNNHNQDKSFKKHIQTMFNPSKFLKATKINK